MPRLMAVPDTLSKWLEWSLIGLFLAESEIMVMMITMMIMIGRRRRRRGCPSLKYMAILYM